MEAAKKDACLKACKELYKDNEIEETGSFSDSDSYDEDDRRRELYEMLVPAVLKEPWTNLENTVCLNSYLIKFTPNPADRVYKKFGLFVKAHIPGEAMIMKLDLHLDRGRYVTTELVPCGVAEFVEDEIMLAEKFQEMCLKVILDRTDLIPDYVLLGKNDFSNSISSTFYLMLPIILHENDDTITVDWKLVRRCLSSPIFRTPKDAEDTGISNLNNYLHLANGPTSTDDVVNSLVYDPRKNKFFFISDLVPQKTGYDTYKNSKNHVEHYVEAYPIQPLLKAKQLFRLKNLLLKKEHSELREKGEHFVELPPEICQLKIIGFSKEIGSSLSLLPSFMCHLESLLVAIELKHRLSASFPEGVEVTAYRVLEACTTKNCNEHFSLERLEVLGDAFLKFAVGRHLFLLHEAMNEGPLTRRRSKIVDNSNLFKLAISNNLHVYIRDQSFEPCQFFALGRRCSVICTNETKMSIHCSHDSNLASGANAEIRCNKCHHWLQKKTVADVVEALIGAFIVDSGFKAATAFLKWMGIQVDFEASQVTKICSASEIFIPLAAQIEIAALEKLLGYEFRHKGMLLQAFVHPSYNNHFGGCYQRLEFLGDAVLDYLITSYLYSVYPNLKPGQLTDLRSMSVNNNSFADIAVNRSFHKFILCESSSLSESMNKYADFIKTYASKNDLVEATSCPKALGDLVESSIGAILLDAGFNLNLVWKIMLSFLDSVMKFCKLQLSPIRELQELCQSNNWDLKFPAVKKDGTFSVEAKVDGEGVSASACATNFNRKAAKRMAAKQLYSMLKARGYKTKTKSLEEVLKSSRKMEAKLIGYDEIPTNVDASLVSQFENLKLRKPFLRDRFQKVHPINVAPTKKVHLSIRHLRQPAAQSDSSGCQSTVATENSGCNGDSQTAGGMNRGSAKSQLYEICAANCWKPPLFDCCKETGPSHLKEFVFKVVLVIEEASNTTLECIGDPRAKKKDAAEHAAEGALWYLKHVGYLQGKN